MKFMILLLFFLQTASAQIIETESFASILESIENDTLVLVDLDETLIDLPLEAGTKNMRLYLRKIAPQLHDQITLYLSQHIAPIPVDPSAKSVIAFLQKQGITILGFTARPIDCWYQTPANGTDSLSAEQLRLLEIDFNRTTLPSQNFSHPNFRHGIIFVANKDKGAALKDFCEECQLFPKKIVIIDDKLDNLKAVEKAFENMPTKICGYWFRLAEKKHQDFNPHIAVTQLYYLMNTQRLLSDIEAMQFSLPAEHDEILLGIFHDFFENEPIPVALPENFFTKEFETIQ